MTTTQISTERDIAHLIEGDPWRMEILKTVATLNLSDWAVGAGFVRAAVWDALTGKPERTPLPDIDVIYFNLENTDPEHERQIVSALTATMPDVPWDLRNQARMHTRNKDAPYRDSTDALAHWLEIPTCIAARLDSHNHVVIVAPYGVEDLLALRVRPTASGRAKLKQYRDRMAEKNWPGLWPGLTLEDA